MYCICIHKETGELSSMTRSERETMISVLLDLKQPIDTWVIGLKETKEDAEKYIRDIQKANDLIDKAIL